MLLQPFLPLVSTLGELCMVFVRGKFVHAVLKDPAGWNTPPKGDSCVHSCSSYSAVGDSASGSDEQLAALKAAGWDVPGWCAAAFSRQRVRTVTPTAAQLGVASAALAALPGGIPVLARFDLLPMAANDWRLSEIEIFGPELFARSHPAVAELAAAEIDRLLLRALPPTTQPS